MPGINFDSLSIASKIYTETESLPNHSIIVHFIVVIIIFFYIFTWLFIFLLQVIFLTKLRKLWKRLVQVWHPNVWVVEESNMSIVKKGLMFMDIPRWLRSKNFIALRIMNNAKLKIKLSLRYFQMIFFFLFKLQKQYY